MALSRGWLVWYLQQRRKERQEQQSEEDTDVSFKPQEPGGQ